METDVPQVLVREIDPDVLERLKERARRNRRSLQAELKGILEDAAGTGFHDARRAAARLRRRLAGRQHSNSADLVAEDRRR